MANGHTAPKDSNVLEVTDRVHCNNKGYFVRMQGSRQGVPTKGEPPSVSGLGRGGRSGEPTDAWRSFVGATPATNDVRGPAG